MHLRRYSSLSLAFFGSLCCGLLSSGPYCSDFKKAGALFIDSIATFTCYELFDYNTFIFYAVLSALLTVDRVTLKSKVLRSPEVLGCIREIPNLQGLLESFYRSKYADFFAALGNS